MTAGKIITIFFGEGVLNVALLLRAVMAREDQIYRVLSYFYLASFVSISYTTVERRLTLTLPGTLQLPSDDTSSPRGELKDTGIVLENYGQDISLRCC
jgi:hypothetical protein